MRRQVRARSARRIVLACSGGRDSMVLAHVAVHHLKEFSAPVFLLHVHHGLDEQAQLRADHCVQFAQSHSLPHQVVPVAALDHSLGPEAAARQARYQVWREFMRAGDLLWTAHHLNDQAETVLLQLLRGSGVEGLAAMPAVRDFFAGSHIGRPFLAVPASWIAAYARRHKVTFMHDPANDELAYGRNYLRRQVMPLIERRWPAWAGAIARSARHQAEAAALLHAVAEGLSHDCLSNDGSLCLAACRRLRPPQQRLLIRHWLKGRALPIPTESQLNHAIRTFLSPSASEGGCVTWHGAELRRYRGHLYALSPLPPMNADPQTYEKLWPRDTNLDLPDLGLCLRWQALKQQMPDLALASQLTVRLRRGGERYAVASRSGRLFHRPLKKAFQQFGVPPWQRQRVPLIYQNDELRLLWGWSGKCLEGCPQ